MRARLICCTILALGALLTTGAGAGFAQTGLDDSTNAGTQQYGTQDVLGEVGTVEEQEASTPRGQDSVPGSQPASVPQSAAAPQAEGELPFTGLAVVTVLLIGLMLLGAGLVLRRTATRAGSQP